MATESEEFEGMSTDEAVEFMYAQLPSQIQDFLISPERSALVSELSQKHGLHVDQAGQFERAFLFMLLGVNTPEEFVSSLTAAGLSSGTVNALAADVNARVFVPLRDAERRGGEGALLPTPTARQAPLPPPAIEYEPAPPARTLPGSSEPVPVSLPAAASAPQIPAAAPSVPAAREEASLTLEPTPVATQHIAHAMPVAQHQPGWHPAAAVHIFVPTQGPGQQMHVPVQPPAHSPEIPQPVQPAYSQSVSVPAPQPAAAVPPARTESAAASPIVRDYAADPYREPIQ